MIVINTFHRKDWIQLETRHPGGLQWMGPGTYLTAVDDRDGTQLVELRIAYADHLDGTDAIDELATRLVAAVRRLYPEPEADQQDEHRLSYSWYSPGQDVNDRPAVRLEVRRSDELPDQYLNLELERAVDQMRVALDIEACG